jgi:hypothetical protein
MKRTQKLSWLFAVLFLLAYSNQSFAQTAKEFFNDFSTPLTYLGIEYTKNRLINDPTADAAVYKSRHYISTNELVLNEPQHYKISEAFNRSGGITTDIAAVKARNEKINVADIMSSNTADFNRLTEADIATTVKALNLKDKAGVGLIFIMEAMNKMEKKGIGSVWVTLIDMKTKKVLMTERMEQPANGIGDRNYWASVIKKTIVEIEKKKFKEWRKTYGG